MEKPSGSVAGKSGKVDGRGGDSGLIQRLDACFPGGEITHPPMKVPRAGVESKMTTCALILRKHGKSRLFKAFCGVQPSPWPWSHPFAGRLCYIQGYRRTRLHTLSNFRVFLKILVSTDSVSCDSPKENVLFNPKMLKLAPSRYRRRHELARDEIIGQKGLRPSI